MRHPQWQMDTPSDDTVNESSLGDSLKDFQELSLRLSVDGDSSQLEKLSYEKGDSARQDQVKQILSNIKKPETDVNGKQQPNGTGNTVAKYPLFRRRRRLFVIAIDAYNNEGGPDKTMVQVVNEVFRSIKSDSQMLRISGFGLSTAMPISETLQLLKSEKIQVKDFDVLICSSGSEVYYPGIYQCEDEGNFCPDPDYAAHIDYRWGHDGVKTTIEKLMNSQGDDKKPSRVVVEDLKSSNTYCVSFLIKDPSKAMQVDDLRQKLRMRGLRCHVMYCRTSTRLQVVPLLASRSQALSSHWMLVVADPYAQSIYFFDPLGLDPREDLRLLIPMAFKIWLAQKGMKWKNLTWNCVNCPKQPSNTESGYYVMKYMKDIFKLSTTKLEKVFGGRKDYSIKEIDEMRGELAKFIMDIVNEDTIYVLINFLKYS